MFIAPGTELSAQFLGVSLLEIPHCTVKCVNYIHGNTFSAAESARTSVVTFPYFVSRENFDVVWLNKDDGVLPNNDGDSLSDSSEEKFVTHTNISAYPSSLPW